MSCRGKKNYWQQDMSRWTYFQGLMSGIVLLGVAAYLFYGNLLGIVGLLPYFLFYLKDWERKQIRKKKMEFRQQFKMAIQAISTALGVGYSAENALKEALSDLQLLYPKEARIHKELRYMIRQMEMNLPLEQIFLEFAQRTEEEEVNTFATVFATARRSGGDLIDMIRNTVWQMSQKLEVKQEIETFMTAKRLEFQIMSIVPLVMIAYVKWAFPEFMHVLYGNVLGVCIMSVCLGVYLLAYEFGKRMLEIEV